MWFCLLWGVLPSKCGSVDYFLSVLKLCTPGQSVDIKDFAELSN